MTTPPANRLISDDEDEIQPASAPQTARADPKHNAEPADRAEQGRRSTGKGPYPGRRQVTAHIDRQLFLWLKRISAESDKPMVEIFEDALSAYVNTYAAQRKFGGGA